jgi:exopolysaccharide biosynthesis polyprenyl glycosylphosphotransferase
VLVGDARTYAGDARTRTEEPRPRAGDGAAWPSAVRPYNPGLLKACAVLADLVAIELGLMAAFVLRNRPDGTTTSLSVVIGSVSIPLWLGVFSWYRLYEARHITSWLDETGRLTHAVLTSTLLMAAVSFMAKQHVSRGWLVLCFPTTVATCVVERGAARAWFNKLRRSGRSLRLVVVVGANAEAESICGLLITHPVLGYRVVGVTDDSGVTDLLGVPVAGRVADTLSVVRATGAGGVIVATTAVTAAACNRLVRELVDARVHVEMSSSLQGIDAERLTVRPLGTTPIVYVERVHYGGWRAVAKRSFELVCSAIALIVLAPLLGLVALVIKLDSPGTVLFSQVRVGRDGRPFRVLKFRTMVANAEDLIIDLRHRNEADGPLFKVHEDPRITRVGRTIRRFSIDEIPQLWNVVRGEMSLVGPRPALFSEMDQWTLELRSRLRVRPGLTGMWQVSGRSNLDFSEYVRLDLYYVDNWSLWRDLAIIAKTVPVVLRKRGAY